MKPDGGFKVVLTAERCLMSDYNGALFLGFTACAPKTLFKPFLFFRFICPLVPTENGKAKLAPCGTRKIEAALLENGFSEDEVVVASPEHLDRFIGPETKVIGITSNDPLGKGPASTTFAGPLGFIKEEPYDAWKFRELVTNPILRKYNTRIVVGGPGAWQLEDPQMRRKLGIDVVVIGEGEKVAPELFRKIIEGEKVPEVVYGDVVEPEEMPIIKGATIGGVVEIARGCGRGCKFCLPTMQRLRSRPLEHILEEVKVNVRNDVKWITFHAEDVLRYKAHGIRANEKAVIELFEKTMKIEGVTGIGPSHFALATVAAHSKLLSEICSIVGVPRKDRPWIAGQTGIETGSPKLIRRHMPGKTLPFRPEEWPDVVEQAFGICKDSHWVPCGTLIIGLPGETENDIIKTMELMDRLREYKSLIVPLFCVPIAGLKGEEWFGTEKMVAVHWELMKVCWLHNLRWLKVLAEEYLTKMPFLAKLFVMRFVNWIIKKATKSVLEYLDERIEESRGKKTEVIIHATK